jgi:nitrilase
MRTRQWVTYPPPRSASEQPRQIRNGSAKAVERFGPKPLSVLRTRPAVLSRIGHGGVPACKRIEERKQGLDMVGGRLSKEKFMGPTVAAVVQAAPVLFDVQRTLAKLADFASDAAGRGAKLVVFPEAFVGGYPKGLGFGVRLGMRHPEGREEFRRYFDGAVEVPGPTTEAIGHIARSHRLYLVVGVVERSGGTLYCSVIHFGPNGDLLGKRRKLMPTALERVVWGQGDGSTLTVLDADIGKFGAVICWENYMPLLRMAMYARGVELWCAPTVDDRDTWLPTMRHVALEGRCFVLSACQLLRRGDCPPEYSCVQGDDPQTILIRGGSCIVGPLGTVLAGPEFGKEIVLTAELDLSEIKKAKLDFDVTGHYARPDIFRLNVDETPKESVVFDGGKLAHHETSPQSD